MHDRVTHGADYDVGSLTDQASYHLTINQNVLRPTLFLGLRYNGRNKRKEQRRTYLRVLGLKSMKHIQYGPQAMPSGGGLTSTRGDDICRQGGETNVDKNITNRGD